MSIERHFEESDLARWVRLCLRGDRRNQQNYDRLQHVAKISSRQSHSPQLFFRLRFGMGRSSITANWIFFSTGSMRSSNTRIFCPML